jgi:hypothetical protein
VTKDATELPCEVDGSGVCEEPPVDCEMEGASCASIPTTPPAVTVLKTVAAGTPSQLGPGQSVVFDLTVTNTESGTIKPASYTFYEVVPQHTTFTAISNGSADCLPNAVAGMLCTITVSNPVAYNAPQVLKLTFVTANPLPVGTTEIFNLAMQDTTTLPNGCTANGVVCPTPPTDCLQTGATCASVPLRQRDGPRPPPPMPIPLLDGLMLALLTLLLGGITWIRWGRILRP